METDTVSETAAFVLKTANDGGKVFEGVCAGATATSPSAAPAGADSDP